MTFQFKIQIKNISDPPVWRTLVVPGQFSFKKFHRLIQASFGWYDCHLFQFSPSGFGSHPIITIPEAEFGSDSLDAKKIKLSQIFVNEKQTYTYIYDFGDTWIHKIIVEKISPDKTLKADCIAGKGKCPPEDCGGTIGYANVREVLQDPKNPEHEEMKEWLGLDDDEEWDVNEFDLEETSGIVRAL